MKKGKVFGKQSIAVFAMVLALAAAVWLNMKYSSVDSISTASSGGGYLGEALFVDSDKTASAVETSATPTNDYLSAAKAERESNRKKQIEQLEDTVNDAKITDDVKKSAVDTLALITKISEQENTVETLLKAKGFTECLVVISEDNANVIVKAESLLSSQTVQIQDAVTSNTQIKLENVKIITVK